MGQDHWLAPALDPAQQAQEFRLQLIERGRSGGRIEVYHEIPIADLPALRPAAKHLSHPSAQPVAQDRRAHFPAGGDPEPGPLLAVREVMDVAYTTASPAPPAITQKVLRTLVQAVCGPQGLVQRESRLGGQALAAAPATAGEDGPAVLGSHADQETMGALAAAVVRLKRALHGEPRIVVRILRTGWRTTARRTMDLMRLRAPASTLGEAAGAGRAARSRHLSR